MAIITNTLSINPAFLQEIKEDHHEVRQLMHHTLAMLRRAELMRIEYDRLNELMSKLRDQVAMHFSLEEAYGYFDDALQEAPRLSRRAEQLRGEHATLYGDLTEMAEHAEDLLHHRAPAQAVARLAARFERFANSFQRHEQCENDLILEALDDDIGAGD